MKRIGFLVLFLLFTNILYSKDCDSSDYGNLGDNDREFCRRANVILPGGMVTIGNTVLVPPVGSYVGDDKVYDNSCSNYNPSNYITDAQYHNNYYELCNYDNDNDSNTFNSSTATLDLPSGSSIYWAGLYWQGLGPTDTSVFDNLKVKIKHNNSNYVEVTADVVNYDSYKADKTHTFHPYAAFAEITNILKNNNWGEGNYTVANVLSVEGQVPTLGTFGAWTIVVIYKNKNLPYKSFSVFDGYQPVKAYGELKTFDVNITGFYTPKAGDINASVSIFTAEGDKHIPRDFLQATPSKTNTTTTLRPVGVDDQTFNSSITSNFLRDPNLINNNGIDIQIFPLCHTSQGCRYPILEHEETSIKFTFGTDQDYYWASMIAFETQIYEPKLCYDYAYKHNNFYFQTKGEPNAIPYLHGYVDGVNPIEVAIYIRNQESDLDAKGISLHTDMNKTIVKYEENTTYITGINSSIYIGPQGEYLSNNDCNETGNTNRRVCRDTDGDVRIGLGSGGNGYNLQSAGKIGSGEYQYVKFNILPQVSGDINTSLGLALDYYFTIEDENITIKDYELGTRIPICPPATAYLPEWGIFNIISKNYIDTSGNIKANEEDKYNNLYTQVSKRPFSTLVAAYGPGNNYTADPVTDINTTVLVEIIDIGSFHDLNATCANPDANVSQPIFVHVNANSNNHYTTSVPNMNKEYYNFAVRNAAFRIWYFTDGNDTLRENWEAITKNNDHLTLENISGLYDSNVHNKCKNYCEPDSTSVICFKCMRNYYAKPICSRDNFSVRPEAIMIRFYDKNSTSINPLPTYSGISVIPIERIKLAAGYDYSIEINATNHNDNNATRGYTRHFHTAISDVNLSLIWEPEPTKVTSGCNDISSKDINIYMANGHKSFDFNLSQVGQYRLHAIDKDWTAPDYRPDLLQHHTSTNKFITTPDCLINSNEVLSNGISGKNGCIVESNNHINIDNGLKYYDNNLTFRPYRFNIGFNITKGPGNSTLNSGDNEYIYMADISNDTSMSYHNIGPISAVGFNGVTLSNFVKNCFAENIDINISRIMPSTYPVSYKAHIKDINGSNTVITDIVKDVNNSSNIITLTEGNFTKSLMGTTNVEIHLNFDRKVNNPINPLKIVFNDINVSCQDLEKCKSYADLKNDYIAKGNRSLDFNLTHYYGRVHAPDYVDKDADDLINATIYYEIFLDENGIDYANIKGNESIDDVNWYVNQSHTNLDGNISNNGNSSITAANNTALDSPIQINTASASDNKSGIINSGKENITLQYPHNLSHPYKDRIDMNASLWLIYNRFDENATTNHFYVTFPGKPKDWAGIGKTGKTVDLNMSSSTQKRIEW